MWWHLFHDYYFWWTQVRNANPLIPSDYVHNKHDTALKLRSELQITGFSHGANLSVSTLSSTGSYNDTGCSVIIARVIASVRYTCGPLIASGCLQMIRNKGTCRPLESLVRLLQSAAIVARPRKTAPVDAPDYVALHLLTALRRIQRS